MQLQWPQLSGTSMASPGRGCRSHSEFAANSSLSEQADIDHPHESAVRIWGQRDIGTVLTSLPWNPL